MKIDAKYTSINFKAKFSKNALPLVAIAKGSCPLHKKPLLYEALKTIGELFPNDTLSRNNNKIYLSRGGYFSRTISDIKGNAVDDIRSIAMSLEYLKIGLRRYFRPTQEQKIALEKFKNKWGAFAKRRNP